MIWALVPRPRNSARSSSGALTISALSWLTVWVQAVTALRRVVEQDSEGLAVAAAAHDGGMLGDEGVAGNVGGVQGVALGGGAPGRTASAWDLDDLLILVKKKGLQAGAEAAGTLDRPAAPTRQLAGREHQQFWIADGVGGCGGVHQEAADGGDGRGGQGVAVGVDADDAVDGLCQHGHLRLSSLGGTAVVGVGLGGVTARQVCDESRPSGRTSC